MTGINDAEIKVGIVPRQHRGRVRIFMLSRTNPFLAHLMHDRDRQQKTHKSKTCVLKSRRTFEIIERYFATPASMLSADASAVAARDYPDFDSASLIPGHSNSFAVERGSLFPGSC
jgi:hypothetical protein